MCLTKRTFLSYLNNLFEVIKQEPTDIQPWAYYTDGGVDANTNYYFLQNVWKNTTIWYCTVNYANVHVQSVLKPAEISPAENNPLDFLIKPKDKLKIRIPYEKYMADDNDWFHLIKNFQIHLKSGGYNAYVKTFAVFYSESEISNTKFVLMTKRFTKIKTFADIPHLKLDVKWREEDTKNGVEIVELDVSNRKKVERWLKTKDPGVYPLLWISIKQKYMVAEINYKIKQNVAGRFVSLKLLTSSNPNSYSNIDLYNLGLKGTLLEL